MTVNEIIKIVAKELGKDEGEITENTSIEDDLGADSLDAVEIIMELEDVYGVEMDDEKIEDLKTIAELANYIDELK